MQKFSPQLFLNMKKNNSQLLNSLLITVGAALTLYGITSDEDSKYIKILGIIILMLGLYRATNFFIVSEEDRKNEKEEDE